VKDLGAKPSSKDQIVALQSLYSVWQAHSIENSADPRTARLLWASENVGRVVSSFKQLTGDEARRLIDALKQSMGQALTRQPRAWRHINERRRAQAAGTAGRRGVRSATIYMVSADDLARINDAILRLGWTRERFDAWLNSQHSPLRSRSDKQIRTLADANCVWWALKAMLKHAGRWRPDDEKKFKRPARSAVTGDSDQAEQRGPAA